MLGILRRIEEKFQLVEGVTVGAELAETLPNTEIIGATPKMVEIYKKVAKIARIEAPVLVVGESGSGKELVARAVHANSDRADRVLSSSSIAAPCRKPFWKANSTGMSAARLPARPAHERDCSRARRAELCFSMRFRRRRLSFQVKLLRVIQEHEIRRVGSNETIQVDIRLIAATNRDLREMVRTNQFREDLFHRLNVFTIALPALRERAEDIPLLASYFIKMFTEKHGKTVRLAAGAVEAMKRYSWPGNVRELKNMLERAITFNDTGVIQADELEFGEPEEVATAAAAAWPPAGPNGSLDQMEKDHIIKVLHETGGNKKRPPRFSVSKDERSITRQSGSELISGPFKYKMARTLGDYHEDKKNFSRSSLRRSGLERLCVCIGQVKFSADRGADKCDFPTGS